MTEGRSWRLKVTGQFTGHGIEIPRVGEEYRQRADDCPGVAEVNYTMRLLFIAGGAVVTPGGCLDIRDPLRASISSSSEKHSDHASSRWDHPRQYGKPTKKRLTYIVSRGCPESLNNSEGNFQRKTHKGSSAESILRHWAHFTTLYGDEFCAKFAVREGKHNDITCTGVYHRYSEHMSKVCKMSDSIWQRNSRKIFESRMLDWAVVMDALGDPRSSLWAKPSKRRMFWGRRSIASGLQVDDSSPYWWSDSHLHSNRDRCKSAKKIWEWTSR